MVFCIIGLVIFSVLGIFSAKYRGYAKESFKCVTRMATLRPCDTGFDQKMKAKITARFMNISPWFARISHIHFTKIFWAFVILMVVSFGVSVNGLYNYFTYGSCDPHSETCYISQATAALGLGSGEELGCGSAHCAEYGCTCGPKESNCTPENNYSACDGNCDCNTEVCG